MELNRQRISMSSSDDESDENVETQEPLLWQKDLPNVYSSIKSSILIVKKTHKKAKSTIELSCCEAFVTIEKGRPSMDPSNDVCGRVMGEWGKWQLRSVLLIFLVKIPSAWFMACIIFTAPAAQHGEFWCQPPPDIEIANRTHWIKISHPVKEVADEEFAIDFCNVYDDADEHVAMWAGSHHDGHPPKNGSIVPCSNFEHRNPFSYNSLVTQFDLVCSRDILVAVTQFFHLLGILVGGVVATKLIEVISPRRVMLIGMLSQIGCGVLTGVVSIFEVHIFFRFMSAVSCALMFTGGATIFQDITGGRMKTIVCTMFEQFWSIGVIILPAMASLFSSWSHLYMAISCPTIILVFLIRWIPDSPRWLVSKGDVMSAKFILENAAKLSNTPVPNDLERQLRTQAAAFLKIPLPPGWRALWRGHRAKRSQVAVHLAWSIYIVVYYGMLLNIRSFGRDHLFINTVIAGMCEMVGTTIGLMLILFSNRKWFWTSLLTIFGGAVACTVYLLPSSLDGHWRVAILMLIAMTCKVSISSTLALLTTCTSELVPLPQRKMAVFSSVTWARIWLLCAPFVGALVIFGVPVPLTTMGALTILGGFCTLVLRTPEVEELSEPPVIINKLSLSPLDTTNPGIWTVPIDVEKSRL